MLQAELEDCQCCVEGEPCRGLRVQQAAGGQRTRAGEAQVGTDLLRPAC